jgi:hypothetical protein
MGATLDGMVAGSGAVFEAKFMLPWSFSEEAAAEKHPMDPLRQGSCPRQGFGRCRRCAQIGPE